MSALMMCVTRQHLSTFHRSISMLCPIVLSINVPYCDLLLYLPRDWVHAEAMLSRLKQLAPAVHPAVSAQLCSYLHELVEPLYATIAAPYRVLRCVSPQCTREGRVCGADRAY